MAVFTDPFTRANTAAGTGLGTIPSGGPAWQVITGSWNISNNRPATSTVRTSNPLAVVTSGIGNGDISATISPNGGDALYARVVDASNWIRARLRTWDHTTPSTYREYAWNGTYDYQYGHAPTYFDYGYPPSYYYDYHDVYYANPTYYTYRMHYAHDWDDQSGGFHGGQYSYPTSDTRYVDKQFTYQNPTDDNWDLYLYSQQHLHAGGGGSAYHTHRFVRTSQSYVGSSGGGGSYQSTQIAHALQSASQSSTYRDVATTTTTRRYELILEKMVGGVVTELGRAEVASPPTKLRLRAVSSSLSVFYNDNATASVTATDGAHSTATKYGIGRGGSTTGTTNVVEVDQLGLDDFTFDNLNTAPTAPTLLSPTGNTTVDRTQPFIVDWEFTDPDIGDYQSEATLYYKLTSSGTWSSVVINGNTTQYQFAANALAAGAYEWQVQTKDANGVLGTRSASAFFTLGTPPSGPTITSPTNGGTVGGNTAPVTWTHTSQQSYQIRRVADNAGAADTATIYSDTGEIASSTARTHTLSFPVNSRFEHIQMRVKSADLWSSYTSIRVQVSFTPPAAPTTVANTDLSVNAIVVSASHPAPTGSEPSVQSHTFQRRMAGDPVWSDIPLAQNLAPGVAWYDRFASPHVLYEYRTVAHGSNGASTIGSVSNAVSLNIDQYVLRDPDTGDARAIRVSEWEELDRGRDVAVYELLDREDPVVSYGQSRLGRGSFTVTTWEESDRAWLLSMLRAGKRLALLIPPDRVGGPGDVLWFSPLTYPAKRLYSGKTPVRRFPVQFVEVAAP